MNSVYVNRFIRLIIVIGITLTSFYLLFWITKVTYPFLIALFIAYLINPIVNFLQIKIRLPRSLAVIITLLSILSLFAGVITLLITEIVSGSDYLSHNVPKQLHTLIQSGEDFLVYTFIPFIEKITLLFNTLENDQQQTILDNVQNIGTTIATTIGNFIQDFFQKIPAFIGWFPNAATVLIFSTLATFFISYDWARLQSYIKLLTPEKIIKSSGSVFKELKKALFGFIKAQLTLTSFTALLSLIGLLILKIDYAITIAILIGIIDILPYLGSGAIFVPWIIYQAVVGDMSLAIGLGILYLIIIIQRQLLEPKILSSNIGLDPLATLISIFVGFKLFGFFGLIIGPIILITLHTLHKVSVFKDIWRFIVGPQQ